jgi:antitoxin FitA
MPTAITLKNIPDDIYERLKLTAAAHHRSVNMEAIACLERVLMPTRASPQERRSTCWQLASFAQSSSQQNSSQPTLSGRSAKAGHDRRGYERHCVSLPAQ